MLGIALVRGYGEAATEIDAVASFIFKLGAQARPSFHEFQTPRWSELLRQGLVIVR